MNKKMVIATILILIDLMVIYYLYSKSEKEFLFIFIAIFMHPNAFWANINQKSGMA